MSEERKTSPWPWIVAPLIALPVLYVGSFGPACWMVARHKSPPYLVAGLYRPLVSAANSNFRTIADPLCWYADLFAFDDERTGMVDFLVNFL